MIETLIPFLPGFAAAYAIQAVAVASPGPDVALMASFGIAVGAACLALVTMQGLSLLMERVAWLSALLRIAGVCYLLWLVFNAWCKALTPPAVSIACVAGMPPYRAFLTGFLLQITNPKAIVFWVAIATVGATDAAPAPILALFILGAYAVLLSSQPFRLVYDRARSWIEGAISVFLTYMAFRMATDRS
ncbi:MAG: LysE family translocator [Paracoccus sp. (in: a-proteobacteria)]